MKLSDVEGATSGMEGLHVCVRRRSGKSSSFRPTGS